MNINPINKTFKQPIIFYGRKSTATPDGVKDLIDKGYNNSEIAKYYNKTATWVRWIIKRFDLEMMDSPTRIQKIKNRKQEVLEQKTNEIRERLKKTKLVERLYNDVPQGCFAELRKIEQNLRDELKNQEINNFKKDFLDKIRQGYTKSEIIAEYNISAHTIKKYISKDDILNAQKDKIKNKKEQIKQMMLKGLILKEIAIKMGCQIDTLNKIVTNEEKQQWREEFKKNVIQKIINYKSEGMTNKKIAELMNLSKCTIKKFLKDINGTETTK